MSKLNASSLCMFHITCIFVEEGEPFGGPLRFAIMVVLCNMLSLVMIRLAVGRG